ncbi:hypothetical protein COLO4_33350 [Corchorus olitorius]|uniref:Uncharacterized protein n=1 Tax=Corchorus olitorius TaxID=93759 RepID=A0A1R3GUD3_9ROSI|nr:hypothetical protein COLO4_33350 [Corchorus olitorius]
MYCGALVILSSCGALAILASCGVFLILASCGNFARGFASLELLQWLTAAAFGFRCLVRAGATSLGRGIYLGATSLGRDIAWVRYHLGATFTWVRHRLGAALLGYGTAWVRNCLGVSLLGRSIYLGVASFGHGIRLGVALLGCGIYLGVALLGCRNLLFAIAHLCCSSLMSCRGSHYLLPQISTAVSHCCRKSPLPHLLDGHTTAADDMNAKYCWLCTAEYSTHSSWASEVNVAVLCKRSCAVKRVLPQRGECCRGKEGATAVRGALR